MLKTLLSIKATLTRGCMALMLFSSVGYAEIYKWRDADGHIHFSDTKAGAGQLNVEELKERHPVNLMPRLSQPKPKSKKEQLANYQSQIDRGKSPGKRAKSKEPVDDSIDYRCTLARNIISGSVNLVNGLPTGKHEIKVAQRDIRKFCP